MSSVVVVSYSELAAFRQCPFKHKLAYIDRWTKDKREGALARGTLWHKCMEAHYRVIMTWQNGLPDKEPYPGEDDRLQDTALTAVAQVIAKAMDDGTAEDEIDLIKWMYAGYVERYGLDLQWQIVAVEHPIQIPLFDPDTGRKTRFRLKARLDLVVRDRQSGRLWILDHKTHKDMPNQKDMDFEEQFGLYQAAMARVGHRVFGSIYSTARTYRLVKREMTLAERYDRVLLARTDAELNSILRDALRTARSAYSARNEHERHPDSGTCKWKCDYTEACLVGRKTTDARTAVFLGDVGFRQDHTRH